MYYLIGSFLALVMALNAYYTEYYSPYEEIDIEGIMEEHPESKYTFAIAFITSWLFIAVYLGQRAYFWIKYKFKRK